METVLEEGSITKKAKNSITLQKKLLKIFTILMLRMKNSDCTCRIG